MRCSNTSATDPRELLFQFGRCVVHFAVDDAEVRFCTHLKGKASWFLPFNEGWNDGAGNPPNPDGLKTDYLWKRILTPARANRHPRKLCPDSRASPAPAIHYMPRRDFVEGPRECTYPGRSAFSASSWRFACQRSHGSQNLLSFGLERRSSYRDGTTFWWRLSEGQTSKLPESGESLD